MRHRPARPHVAHRERRGATIVLVAVLGVALVGITAFAVDVSRMYVGANELQTVSDASALRGAQFMQGNPGADPSSQIIAYSLQNQALNGTVTVAGSDIRPARWDESLATLDSSGSVSWATANAVQVTARKTAGLLFGKVLRSVAPIPARRSAAWIANLTSSRCIKPWGMPMPEVLTMVGASPSPVRALTPTELQTLRGLSQLQRTLIIAPPYSGNGQVPNPTPNGLWAALRVNGNGMSQYQDAVEDATCANGAVGVGAKEKDKPGNNIDSKTTQSIDVSTCGFVNGSDTCFDFTTHTIPGVSVIVAFTTIPVSSGTETVQVIMLAEFVIQCYRRENGGTNTCVSAKVSAADWLSYSEGTLLGYINPDFADLGPGTGLGNTIGTGQRLILVK